MKLNDFIEGLTILRPYYNDPNGYHVAAEHDQFYMYATDKPVSEADFKRLRELGWFQPDAEEGPGDPPPPPDYAPEEGWSAFV